ncbi:MAG TPA: hypothetical protein VFZ09_43160 [Archangium sp.]|uniref:hypothetical protein n=1 Tax=Archangium sp. TaxID=1872627 RepID=UPI002E315F67|nr:hypothetical protein [Archangium sp.]HEX5753079.1 hypothetical protein [Archangium sp.]
MAATATETPGPRPALFTRVPPVAAMVLVALNDHVLKGAGLLPGWLTGKLSDFAGLYFAPLLVAELWMLARPSPMARVAVRRVAWAALGFGLLFTTIKTFPPADRLYEAVLTALLRRPAGNTVDPTDLLALVMPGVAVWDVRRLMRRSRPA